MHTAHYVIWTEATVADKEGLTCLIYSGWKFEDLPAERYSLTGHATLSEAMIQYRNDRALFEQHHTILN